MPARSSSPAVEMTQPGPGLRCAIPTPACLCQSVHLPAAAAACLRHCLNLPNPLAAPACRRSRLCAAAEAASLSSPAAIGSMKVGGSAFGVCLPLPACLSAWPGLAWPGKTACPPASQASPPARMHACMPAPQRTPPVLRLTLQSQTAPLPTVQAARRGWCLCPSTLIITGWWRPWSAPQPPWEAPAAAPLSQPAWTPPPAPG